MLGKSQEKYAGEEVLFEGKASIFLECKKIAIYLGLIFFILFYSSIAIQFVAKMQESVVRVFNVPFTSYFVLAIYFTIFILVVLNMLSILSWKSKSYNITNIRVIAKRGFFISKTDYVIYSHIQDVSTSRGVFGKIFGCGTIKIFNGVDGGTVVLKNVSQIKNVEELIFKQMALDSQRCGGFNQGQFDTNNNNNFNNNINNNPGFNNGFDNRFNNDFVSGFNKGINDNPNNYNYNNPNIQNQNNQQNNPNINIHDYYNTPYNRNNDFDFNSDLNNSNLNNSNNSNNNNSNIYKDSNMDYLDNTVDEALLKFSANNKFVNNDNRGSNNNVSNINTPNSDTISNFNDYYNSLDDSNQHDNFDNNINMSNRYNSNFNSNNNINNNTNNSNDNRNNKTYPDDVNNYNSNNYNNDNINSNINNNKYKDSRANTVINSKSIIERHSEKFKKKK